jgi:hypothetical protein
VKTEDRERYSFLCTDVRFFIQGQNFNFIKFLPMEGYRMKSVGALGGTEEDTEEGNSLLDNTSLYTEGGRVRADGLVIFTSEGLEVVVTTSSLHSGGSTFEIYNRLMQGNTNFPKSKSHVKILEARRLK